MAYIVHICTNVKLAPIPFKKGRTRINLMGDMIPLLSYYYSESKNRKIVHFFIKDQLKEYIVLHTYISCIISTITFEPSNFSWHAQVHPIIRLNGPTYFLNFCTIFEFLTHIPLCKQICFCNPDCSQLLDILGSLDKDL